jgi:hypothetical protein
VKFSADGLAAFESRTVLKPRQPGTGVYIDEARFLEGIDDGRYRQVLRELLDVCRGLDLRFAWGTTGTSIRLPTADGPLPLTVGWLFPSGGRGWMGLSDLNLGFDTTSAAKSPRVDTALEAYLAQVAAVPGAEPINVKNLRAFHFGPQAVVEGQQQIAEVLADLVRRVNNEAPKGE